MTVATASHDSSTDLNSSSTQEASRTALTRGMMAASPSVKISGTAPGGL